MKDIFKLLKIDSLFIFQHTIKKKEKIFDFNCKYILCMYPLMFFFNIILLFSIHKKKKN